MDASEGSVASDVGVVWQKVNMMHLAINCMSHPPQLGISRVGIATKCPTHVPYFLSNPLVSPTLSPTWGGWGIQLIGACCMVFKTAVSFKERINYRERVAKFVDMGVGGMKRTIQESLHI